MKKYNKEILASKFVYYDNKCVEVLILDDEDCYNIHIIDEDFKDDELNTLKLQEPKEYIQLEKISDPISLECLGLEHLLWDKFYGFENKLYDFSVSVSYMEEL